MPLKYVKYDLYTTFYYNMKIHNWKANINS